LARAALTPQQPLICNAWNWFDVRKRVFACECRLNPRAMSAATSRNNSNIIKTLLQTRNQWWSKNGPGVEMNSAQKRAKDSG
jgi:hypothetical protein